MKLLTKEEEISKRINKSKQLIDQGKCPTCGQDLHGSAMHETILSDKEHLASLKNELVAISKKEEEFDLKMEQLKQIKAVSKRMEDCDDLIRSSSETIDMYQKRLLDHVSRIDDDNKRLNEAVSLKQKMMADVTQQKEQEQLLQEAVSISIKKHAEALKKLDLAKEAQQKYIKSESERKDIEKLEERIQSDQEKIGLLDQQIIDGKQRLSEIDKKMGE